jgi:hypothetical protein
MQRGRPAIVPCPDPNEAMKRRQRIEFRPEWFDANSTDLPDPDMQPEIIRG